MDETERPSEREQRIADAVAEFSDLLAEEQEVDREGFLRRYPGLEPELSAGIQTLLDIEKLLEPRGRGEKAEEVPFELSGYRVVCRIGSGGMGQVLLALDQRLGRKLAIKMLSPEYRDNAVVRTRFMDEARALARIDHPNIVRIYNLGQEDEPPHFVMEHVEGVPLADAAAGWPVRQKVELFLKVSKAVAFLHDNGIIHRDLKPGNILVQANQEPKILDFGLALRIQERSRALTLKGELLGTPAYFSPEQASTETTLDVRSDVFSLGTVLYELVTGKQPFSGDTLREQIEAIKVMDPVLPGRLNREVSAELQRICMMALEKDPADRYPSAGDFARDLERYLAGESVIASPRSYSRMMADRIAAHIKDLEQWKHDRILSEYEHDSFRKLYEGLIDREDAWILEMRRFSLMQVVLYLGAWLLVIGAFLFALFEYESMPTAAPVLFSAVVTAGTYRLGIRVWKTHDRKRAVPILLAFCLLIPTTLILAMQSTGAFAGITREDPELELFHYFSTLRMISNAQMWWAILLSLPFFFWLRRLTGSSVFSLVLSTSTALLCLVTLLMWGAIEWLETDPGRPFFYLLPFAAGFLATGLILERLRRGPDAKYFYPVAVIFMLAALSGVAAFHEPYADWLGRNFPFTRGQVEYLFIFNALLYWALQRLCEAVSSPQMRRVANAFRFFIPGHVLTSVFLLGLSATDLWHQSPDISASRWEARFFEILLLLLAGGFVFAAIPRQMKNFLATGMFFLAVGVIRLQQDLLANWVSWPISLMISGVILIVGAGSIGRLKGLFRRPK